jgi:hypothetical protein
MQENGEKKQQVRLIPQAPLAGDLGGPILAVLRRDDCAEATAEQIEKSRQDAGATKGDSSFAILLDELLVARVGAEVGEIGTVVDGGEIAEAQLERFLHGGKRFVLVALR